MSDLYYIQSKKSGYIGNSLVWWNEGGKGYTCDLNKAWKLPRHEAIKYHCPANQIRPVDEMDAIAQRHIDMQDLTLSSSKGGQS